MGNSAVRPEETAILIRLCNLAPKFVVLQALFSTTAHFPDRCHSLQCSRQVSKTWTAISNDLAETCVFWKTTVLSRLCSTSVITSTRLKESNETSNLAETYLSILSWMCDNEVLRLHPSYTNCSSISPCLHQAILALDNEQTVAGSGCHHCKMAFEIAPDSVEIVGPWQPLTIPSRIATTLPSIPNLEFSKSCLCQESNVQNRYQQLAAFCYCCPSNFTGRDENYIRDGHCTFKSRLYSPSSMKRCSRICPKLCEPVVTNPLPCFSRWLTGDNIAVNTPPIVPTQPCNKTMLPLVTNLNARNESQTKATNQRMTTFKTIGDAYYATASSTLFPVISQLPNQPERNVYEVVTQVPMITAISVWENQLVTNVDKSMRASGENTNTLIPITLVTSSIQDNDESVATESGQIKAGTTSDIYQSNLLTATRNYVENYTESAINDTEMTNVMTTTAKNYVNDTANGDTTLRPCPTNFLTNPTTTIPLIPTVVSNKTFIPPVPSLVQNCLCEMSNHRSTSCKCCTNITNIDQVFSSTEIQSKCFLIRTLVGRRSLAVCRVSCRRFCDLPEEAKGQCLTYPS